VAPLPYDQTTREDVTADGERLAERFEADRTQFTVAPRRWHLGAGLASDPQGAVAGGEDRTIIATPGQAVRACQR
jgi:hypothetical protein